MKITPPFEAAFELACLDHRREDLLEILDIFEHGATRDPRAAGEPLLAVEGYWVYEIPYVERLPIVALIYTIDDEKGLVVLWGLTCLPTS